MQDFDAALGFLFDAIEICLEYDPDNIELPLYIIEVGKIFIKKGAYEEGRYWCQTGLDIANKENNTEAKKEAIECLAQLDILEGTQKSSGDPSTV